MKVTVILPVYNGERYLERSIKSILKQTFTDFELIIVDDGSTDHTGMIAKSYQSVDNRIKVLTNRKNEQLAKSCNEALDKARGEYIARMDSDDESYPQRLAKQVKYLDAHPDVGVLGTNFKMINYDGFIRNKYFEKNKAPLEWLMLFENPIANPTVMYRKSLLDKNDLKYRNVFAEDYDLWIRLAMITKFERLDEVLLDLHRRTDSWFNSNIVGQLSQAVLLNDAYAGSITKTVVPTFHRYLTKFTKKNLHGVDPRTIKLWFDTLFVGFNSVKQLRETDIIYIEKDIQKRLLNL